MCEGKGLFPQTILPYVSLDMVMSLYAHWRSFGEGPPFCPIAELTLIMSIFADFILSRMWSWNVSLLSNQMPKYLMPFWNVRGLLSINKEGYEGIFLVNRVVCVFEGLNVSPAVGPHSIHLSIAICIWSAMSLVSEPRQIRKMSSA